MAVSVLCAYGLSRTGSLGHRWLLLALLATMFFSAGLIPTYLLVQSLGLTDSYLALILPSAISVFNRQLLRRLITRWPPWQVCFLLPPFCLF